MCRVTTTTASKRKNRVLMLCHTAVDNLTSCDTSGLPLTLSMMRIVESADLPGSAADHPDHGFDLTLPIPNKLLRQVRGRYDLVTTMCCNYDAFVRPDGLGLQEQAWRNVSALLKPGGFFLFSTALMGLASLNTFLQNPVSIDVLWPKSSKGYSYMGRSLQPVEPGSSRAKAMAKVLKALGKHVATHRAELSLVPASRKAFRDWYNSLTCEHAVARRFRIDIMAESGPDVDRMIRDGEVAVFMRPQS